LNDDTEYHFHIVANRSGSTINDYNGTEDIANGKMDLYIDDNLVANDIDITNNQNAAAFRIYQINDSTYAEIDNIYIDDTALAPFTPTAITLSSLTAHVAAPWTGIALAGVLLGALVLVRRKR
ncbi:MAG: hypothetical protein U9R05_04200, partial [Chloroflexota bacterium]|nr:hypothetical protein [Chloroflexota bacterium]